MARGANAKVNVENKIREAFGNDFAGMQDKKLYVWADDGGEKVQIAISLTCPKTPLGVVEDSMDFDNMNTATPTGFQPAEITSKEMENLRRLSEKYNL